MADLPPAEVDDLARQWSQRLAAEPTRFLAKDIYGGRGFREASTAAKLLDSRLLVVSAGLGLIDVSTPVPPYACTVLVDTPDSVRSRVIGSFSVECWWERLCKASPFAIALGEAIQDAHGLVCAALSDAYIEMISEDLLALPTSMLGRLRLFTRARLDRIPAAIQPLVMPYDDRLDGPDSSNRGTRSDFAGRALRHFAELIRDEPQGRSAAEHASAVSTILSGWRMPTKVDRMRHNDAVLLDLIRAHWDAERGSTSRLLRRFRDDLGVACEQGRFSELAHQVRSERA